MFCVDIFIKSVPRRGMGVNGGGKSLFGVNIIMGCPNNFLSIKDLSNFLVEIDVVFVGVLYVWKLGVGR